MSSVKFGWKSKKEFVRRPEGTLLARCETVCLRALSEAVRLEVNDWRGFLSDLVGSVGLKVGDMGLSWGEVLNTSSSSRS